MHPIIQHIGSPGIYKLKIGKRLTLVKVTGTLTEKGYHVGEWWERPKPIKLWLKQHNQESIEMLPFLFSHLDFEPINEGLGFRDGQCGTTYRVDPEMVPNLQYARGFMLWLERASFPPSKQKAWLDKRLSSPEWLAYAENWKRVTGVELKISKEL